MTIERSLRSLLRMHLPQQSAAALQHRRRLLIALGADTFTGGLNIGLIGGSAAHAARVIGKGRT